MNIWTWGKIAEVFFWLISIPAVVRWFVVPNPSVVLVSLAYAFWFVLALHVLASWLLLRDLRQASLPYISNILGTWLFGFFHWFPTRRRCREIVAEQNFLHAFSHRDVPWSVAWIQLGLQGVFGLFSLLKRGRATHTDGIAATGVAHIEPSPDFPAHDFFVPGQVYPVVLRHANLTHADCRRRDIRGAALRFGGLENNGLFDMVMNTGTTSAFWDLPSFLGFMRLNPLPLGLKRYLERFPLAISGAFSALYWGPESYARLPYYSQLVYRFVGKDGVLRFIRYRLIPAEGVAEDPGYADVSPWEDQCRPDDNRTPDYLMKDYAQRLEEGVIRYRFQAQLRNPDDDPEICNSGKTWDDVPWLDVATITVDTLLAPEETRRLSHNIGNHPRSLGLLPARHWRDYNALALVRVAVYRASALARFCRRPFARPRWDHSLHGSLPRARKNQGRTPQGQTWGRALAFYGPTQIKTMLNYVFNEALGHLGLRSTEQIQRTHRPNLTILQEQQSPGSTQADSAFAHRMINGFYPVPLFQKQDDPQRFIAHFCWDRERFEGELGLANSWVQLRREDSLFVPEQIAIQFRRPGEKDPSPQMEPQEILEPRDGERWKLAKQLVHHSICLEGQALGHFVQCHVNMEQYAVAAYRRLQSHPLAALLFPHLKGVVDINRQGEGIIFGETGILCVNSALSADAANSLFVRHLGGLSWADWRPRPPLCDTDQYAKIANLYWEIVREHVASYIRSKQEQIGKTWSAVYAFSQDLVLHSVPYSTPSLFPHAQRVGLVPDAPARVTLGSVEKALPPITLQPRVPLDADWNHLIQACSYIIFHATLFHTWTNDRMHDTLGEVAFMNFGVRDTELREAWKQGMSRPLLPPPVPAAYQLFLVDFLVRLRYGLLLANEDKDVPQSLIQSLEKHRNQFETWGLSIDQIRSCINI